MRKFIHYLICGLVIAVSRMASAEEVPKGIYFEPAGKNMAAIIVPDNPEAGANYAAGELNKYLYLSLGVSLPIHPASAKNIPRPAFVIGKSAFTDELGLDLAKLPPEGFYIKTTPDFLVIAGNDHPLCTVKMITGELGFRFPGSFQREAGTRIGTLFGVYTFLKKYVGAEWFFVGPLGEVIPKLNLLKIPAIDYTASPSFRKRILGLGTDAAGVMELPYPDVPYGRRELVNIWPWRMRHGSSLTYSGSHSMEAWGNLFGKDHPEYFALIKGRRSNDWGWNNKNKGGFEPGRTFCWTSRAMINQQIEEMRLLFQDKSSYPKWFTERVDTNYYTIGGNDCVQESCECAECSKWYYKGETNIYKVHGGSTEIMVQDAFWYHVAEVAKAAQKEFPGRFIVGLAYNETFYPPKNVKLPENVKISLAGAFPELALPEMQKAWDEFFNEWEKKADIAELWIYPTAYRWGHPHMPVVFPHLLAGEIKARASKVAGIKIDAGSVETGPYMQPEIYVASELMWDATQDTDEVLDRFYNKLYGDAAPLVKACYSYLENTWCEEYAGKFTGKDRSNHNKIFREIAWTEIFTPQRLKKAMSFLKKAEKLVPRDSMEAIRIQRCENQLLETMGACLEDSLKVKPKPKADQNTAVDPAKFPEIQVMAAAKPPVIDGEFPDEAWQRPHDGVMVKVDDGTQALYPTYVWISRDEDNLYLGVKCMEHCMTELNAFKATGSNTLSHVIFGLNDDVEIFLDTENQGKNYSQIAIDAAGQTWSSGPKGSAKETINLKSGVKKYGDYWCVEAAIPFSELGGKPAKDSKWGINVTRTWTPKGEAEDPLYFALFPSGSFQAANKYGRIKF